MTSKIPDTSGNQYFLEGRKIVEKFIMLEHESTALGPSSFQNTNNNIQQTVDYYIVAATPQEEYRQLRFMESVREKECIQLYEENKLAQARILDQRLDLIRDRMKEVETLCRYTQALYSDSFAAQEAGFRPNLSSPTSNIGSGDKTEFSGVGAIQAARKNREISSARQHEISVKQGIPSVLSSTTSAFHFEGDGSQINPKQKLPSAKDSTTTSGYALVFCCQRTHPEEAFENISRKSKDSQKKKTGNWKSALDMFEEMQMEKVAKTEEEFLHSQVLKRIHEEKKNNKAPSMKAFLESAINQIKNEDQLMEEQREQEEMEEQRKQIQAAHRARDDAIHETLQLGKNAALGVSFLSSDSAATISTSTGMQNQQQQQPTSLNQSTSGALLLPLPSSSNGALLLPPFDANQHQSSPTANKQQQQQLKRSEKQQAKRIQHEILAATRGKQNERQTYQLSLSCDGRVDEQKFTSESQRLSSRIQTAIDDSMERLPLARWGAENRAKKIEVAMAVTLDSLFGVIVAKDKDDAEGFFKQLRNSETLGSFEERVKSVSGSLDCLPLEGTAEYEQLLQFTQPNKKQKPVGIFTKIMSRVIPAGGSRACSEVLDELISSGFNKEKKNNNNNNNSHLLGSKTLLSDSSTAASKNSNTPWWMKATSAPSIELAGLTDALQRVITSSTPFVPQHAMDTIIRGGTANGALDAPDDKRAAALCFLIDGDCGWDYTLRDVDLASKVFAKIVESYYGEVTQPFGDYAVAVFWSRPAAHVIDQHEDDDATMSMLPKGVPLYRLSPASRAVLAAMELQQQVKRACCGIAVAKPPLTKEQKSTMLPYRTRNVDIVKLIRKGVFAKDDDDEDQTENHHEEVADADAAGEQQQQQQQQQQQEKDVKIAGVDNNSSTPSPASVKFAFSQQQDSVKNKNKLNYNAQSHVDPHVRVSGDAVEEAINLALLSEKQLRRPVVVSSFAADDCDSAVARLNGFTSDLIQYFAPTSIEYLRLDEPPAERLVGKYHYDSSFDLQLQQQQDRARTKKLYEGNDDDDDDNEDVVIGGNGFEIKKVKSTASRMNFHSVHSEPALRRLFKNLEPYRGCGYILRSQLKEVLYPLCFADPLRSQAGGGLEAELVAQARARFEEYEKNKYDSVLANEYGDSATELSPMEAMRLMLATARKQQRIKQKARAEANSHGDSKFSLSEQLKDQQRLAGKLANEDKRRHEQQQQQLQSPKKSLFDAESAAFGKSQKSRTGTAIRAYEIQSDIHPDALLMYKEVFGIDMVGVTHDVLDTMLTPLRNNIAQEHVTFPEFCLFAARLQAE